MVEAIIIVCVFIAGFVGGWYGHNQWRCIRCDQCVLHLDGPEWFFTCVEGGGEIYAHRRGNSKYDAELFSAVLDERLLEAIKNNWCEDQRKGLGS